MNRNSPVPLWAMVAVGVVLLGGVYAIGQPALTPPQASVIAGQSTESLRPNVPAPTTTSPTAAAMKTSSLGTPYDNSYYHYSLDIPNDWRLADQYDRRWNAPLELPSTDPHQLEYLALTTASESEEVAYLEADPDLHAGTSDFARGRTIFIMPSTFDLGRWDTLAEAATQTVPSGGMTTTSVRLNSGNGALFTNVANGPDAIASLYVQCQSSSVVRSIAEEAAPLRSIAFRMQDGAEGTLLSLANSLKCQSQ